MDIAVGEGESLFHGVLAAEATKLVELERELVAITNISVVKIHMTE